MAFAVDPDDLLIWLTRSTAERALVGGKGASLSQLAALGAPVPAAFALTTRVYQEFASAIEIPERASQVADADLPGIREKIQQAPLPPAMEALITSGYETLRQGQTCSSAVAVRSSATAEDSAECSFAGLHDTILDVRDVETLIGAVKQCWASMWSDRAVSYRRAGGFAADEAAIGVVVQELVPSDVSFVVFTADPVSNDGDVLMITASWGLGEAVVSGLVVPDQIVIDVDGLVTDYKIGDKHLMIIPADKPGQCTREVPVPKALRSLPALTHEQAMDIGRTARSLASQLGYKADIEGAIARGSLYILQARPITTLTSPNGNQVEMNV